MMDVPPICLLELSFRVLSTIDNLPHFHGLHISALFRHLLKTYLPKGKTLSSSLITIVPVDTGVSSFLEGECLHVYITYPHIYHGAIKSLVDELSVNAQPRTSLEGHFIPGRTIILENVICRITNESEPSNTPNILTWESLKDEIELLKNIEEFSLLLYTPLRLPRPKGSKVSGHRYCDDGFFCQDNSINDPVKHLLYAIEKRLSRFNTSDMQINTRLQDDTIPLFKIADSSLLWIDCQYGHEPVKTIGGIVGRIKISGRCNEDIARCFVLGQYIGFGKNTAFGFGAYIIPELDGIKKIKPPTRGKTLIKRALHIECMKDALYRLPNSSPGIDSISVSDVKKVGIPFLEKLSQDVLSGTYKQGELKRYRLPKEDGGYRDIYIQCVSDRLIHKVVADYLAPIIDRLLMSSAWAYRKGLNRRGAAEALNRAISAGYTYGIKADIATFFDSVNTKKLIYILEGLLPFEPIVEAIDTLINHFTIRGIKGLPQGSPLSPVLSNLYLTNFDRDMEKEGFKLARYSDDFVILTKDSIPKDMLIESIQRSLSRLDLTLKEEKIMEVKGGSPLNFLGYLVSKDAITENPENEEKDGAHEEWLPVFRDEWIEGQPVYLTSLANSAYSSGPDLVIKSDKEVIEKVPWNRVSRLVVVGRAPVTGGVIYRALKEEIPVSFIDILGRTRGTMYPEYTEMTDLSNLQEEYTKNIDFILSFAKEIISAKIHNSHVILRRNGVESDKLKELERKIYEASSLDILRGYEGTAARLYFSEFAHLVEPFEFKGRVYHPPDGPVNVMLSLTYTLLYNRISSVLKSKGFNARLGLYHKGRGAHNALASDFLEELRHIAERIVLSLIHLKEITKDDFSISKKKKVEVCRIEGDGFRKIIRKFEKTMAQKASYHGGEKMSYNAYLDEMADSLRRSFKLQIPYRALRID